MLSLQPRACTRLQNLQAKEELGVGKLKVPLLQPGMRLIALAASVALPNFALGQSTTAPTASAQTSPPISLGFYRTEGDREFSQPYVDVDEWRTQPVHHRYVHGGFTGTETRFSYYFPDKADYRGRFFQHITPVPDDENASQKLAAGEDNKIAFAIASGAYFVETNGGGKLDLGKAHTSTGDPTIGGYRANANAAAYSRVVAQEMYGGRRPFGYAYGGSGGAFRTIGLMENTRGVWDGAVPYVVGSTQAIPNMFTGRIRVMRLLGDKLDQVVSAADPGGSGDIYAGLTQLQAEALREMTRLGFLPQSWYAWRDMGIHGFAALYPGIAAADPTYFTDFWTKPGYLGFDDPAQFKEARLQFRGKVAHVLTASEAARAGINLDASSERQRGGVDTAFKVPEGAEGRRIVAYRLTGAPPKIPFLGGDLIIGTGAARDKRLPLARIVGDVVVLGVANGDVAAVLKGGDEVTVDNSNFLAMETYHRHQVPGPEFKVWDQFRNTDGTPKYPQRPRLLGPMFIPTVGRKQTGEIEGKMIVVSSLWDREALPWQADWYANRVKQHLGARFDENFRLWYTDHAVHGDFSPSGLGEDATRIVSYVPVLQQALRDLADWVEKGVSAPTSTQYKIVDGQVIVPPSAEARKGIQPVVSLRVNGSDRVEAKAGQSVSFDGAIGVPKGAGSVIAADWDFDGSGTFPISAKVPAKAKSVKVSISHTFTRPGTYFAVLRGTANRQGDRAATFARIQNLARVRVVVK